MFTRLTLKTTKHDCRTETPIDNRQPNIARLIYLAILMLVAFSPITTFAQTSDESASKRPIASINHFSQVVSLNPYLETIEDRNHEYTIADIKTGKLDHLWLRNNARNFVGQNLKSKYWYRLTIENTSANDIDGYIYQKTQPSLVYRMGMIFDGDNPRQIVTGQLENFAQRDVDSRPLLFKVDLAKGNTLNIVGWIDNSESMIPPVLALSLMSPVQVQKVTQLNNALVVAFYSIIISLLIYNGFLFLSLRDKAYGFYLLFLLSGMMMSSSIDGTAHQWVLRSSSTLLGQLSGVCISLAYLLFVSNALNVFERWPRYYYFYWGYIIAAITSMILIVFFPYSTLLQYFVQILASVSIGVNMVIIISSILHGNYLAIYLIIAELSFSVGATFFMLMINNVIEVNDFSMWSTHIGIYFEALLLSLALANRTRMAQQEAIAYLADYEALYQNSVEGRFQYTIDGGAIKCNPALATLFGYSCVDDFISDNRALNIADEATNKNLSQLLSTKGRVTDFEMEVLHKKTSNSVWVSLNMRVIKNSKGDTEFIEGSAVNISERKLKERAEKEKQIIAAQNKAKNYFFASMSHEFRTPLTAILGYAEMGKRSSLTENERIENSGIIEHAAKHLLQLINDILDVSKIEANKLDVETLEVDLATLLKEVEDYCKILVAEKDIVFKISYSFPLPKIVKSDPTRLKQVLINLCSNAIKFTSVGEVNIAISGSVEDQQLIFEIKDTGIGLKKEEIEQLFTAFNQASSSTTRNFGGTGLGLYLSKQMANKLGGDLHVTSEHGVGSNFRLDITTGDISEEVWVDNEAQLYGKDADSTAIPYSINRADNSIGCKTEKTERPSARKLTILLVDDNPVNQKLISFYIKETGNDCLIASDGAEAIAKAIYEDIDIIFIDYHMPIMDGMTAVRILREKGFTKPIYALTADETPHAIQAFNDSGCDGYLAKPFDVVKIKAIIQQASGIDAN